MSIIRSGFISGPGACSCLRVCGRPSLCLCPAHPSSLCCCTQCLCIGPPCPSSPVCPIYHHLLCPAPDPSRGWWVSGKACLCLRIAAVRIPSSLPARPQVCGAPILWGSSPVRSPQTLRADPPPVCLRPVGPGQQSVPPCTQWRRILWRSPWRCPGPTGASECLRTWRTLDAVFLPLLEDWDETRRARGAGPQRRPCWACNGHTLLSIPPGRGVPRPCRRCCLLSAGRTPSLSDSSRTFLHNITYHVCPLPKAGFLSQSFSIEPTSRITRCETSLSGMCASTKTFRAKEGTWAFQKFLPDCAIA